MTKQKTSAQLLYEQSDNPVPWAYLYSFTRWQWRLKALKADAQAVRRATEREET